MRPRWPNKVHVVHCPRCHFYFHHDPFPLRRLAEAGVNLCLGTDSLASVYKTRRQNVELSLFEKMRALARNEPSLSARKIVRMATLNGAAPWAWRGNRRVEGSLPTCCPPSRGKIYIYDSVLHQSGAVAAA
jgi:cytosine/adenosine deaminase-related metal-dependent hydrolase